LLRRGIEAEVVPACFHHGLGVLAWSPSAAGVLTGKYRGGVPGDSRGADEYWRDRVSAYGDVRGLRVVDAVATAAEGLGVSPLAVALSWVRDRPGVGSTLLGARTEAQLKMAVSAGVFDLPPQIRLALDDVSA
jgi:aryl-alcohol dehydrogenase-like predicted oxidoreductase